MPRYRCPFPLTPRKPPLPVGLIQAGATIVNDISALRGDPLMATVAADTGAAVVLMHMQGTPQTMQKSPRYRNVVQEVSAIPM